MVDIMLVLLVIFIITAPLLTNAVKIDLPHASSAPNVTKADNIQLAIDADGQLYWDGEKLDRATVLQRLHDAARKQPTPELHLRPDRDTHYDVIADAMSDAGKAGPTKLGSITDPTSPPPAPRTCPRPPQSRAGKHGITKRT